MLYVFRKYGKNALSCYETVSSSPWELAKVLEAYCRFQIITPRSPVKAPPALDGPRRASDTFQSLVAPSGVGRIGPWCLHPTLLSPQTSLVIHWPSFWRRLPFLHTTFPPALFLAGMLLPLVARKSPARAQIIRRGLLEQVEAVMLSEIQNRKGWADSFEKLRPGSVLSKSGYAFEYEFYLSACDSMADDGPFIRACRNSCNATFGEWASVGTNQHLCREYMHKGLVGVEGGEPHYLDCSVLRPGMVAEPRYSVLPEVVLKSKRLHQYYGKKFRPLSQGIVGELLLADDIAMPLLGEEGDAWRSRVIRLGVSHYEREEQKYLAIDWGRWFEYRYNTTGTFFRGDMLSVALGPNKYPLNLATRREELSRKVRSLYAPGEFTILSAPGRLPLPEALVEAWETTAYLVDVIPLEVLELKSYREVSREFGWSGAVRRMTTALKGRKNKRAHRPLFFSLHLLTVGSKTQVGTMKGFHLGRTVYFQVPGLYGSEMFIPESGPERLRTQKGLPQGVLIRENVYSFSARFIERNLNLFPNLSLEHLEQIKAFAGNSRLEIARYVKMYSHIISVGRPSKFTNEQDEAIIVYYRPNMDEDAQTALWTACNGFTAPEVARRAKTLRDKLIWEDSVTDCADLPHQRRTKGLLREIRNAVKAKGK